MATLGLVVPLIIVTFVFVSVAAQRLEEHNTRSEFHTADQLANSGIDMALVELQADPGFSGATSTLEDGGVDYQVVERWTEADSRFVRVVSTGFTNSTVVGGKTTETVSSVACALTAIVRERTFDYDLRQAVFLQDPDVDLDLNGNAFSFSGNDRNYTDGAPGSDGQRPGIASVADPDEVKNEIGENQWDNVTGLGGSPSIYQRSDASTLVADLIDFYKGSATTRLTGETELKDADLGDPDTDEFEIAYVTGTLKLSGESKGAGMLLVVGDLEITGSFDYTGIVAVLGRVVFSGGGSGDAKMINGTLLIGDDVSSGGLRINGNITVGYSSEAVARAKSMSGHFSVEAVMRGRVD